MYSIPVDPTPSFFGGGGGSPGNYGYEDGSSTDDEGASAEKPGNGVDRFRKNVETFFYQFGQKGLKPPDSYIAEGKELGQQVFLKLQKHSKQFKIAEPRFAGSIGKKTDVIEPDLDLVVVLVDSRPPFGSVLKDFENLLELYQEELKIRPNSIECKTRFSLQFVFQNGIEVDLLPAAKLEPEEIYELLQKDPNDYYQYSSSLVGRQLAFMRSHSSSFVHIVIRLAKFWFKSLSFGEKKVYGGSTMMELIGIDAAGNEQAKYNDWSVLRAFAGVLDIVSRLDRFKLAFKLSEAVWERVPEKLLGSRNGSLIPQIVGTEDILNRECFIIEPANPYNDLLGDKDGVMDMFMGFAKETRLRLSNLMDKKYATLNGQTNVMDMGIMKVFEPQPPNLKATFPSGVPRDFQISYSQPCSSLSCGMKVRNEGPLQRKEVQLAVEAIKRNLFTVVNAAAEAVSSSSVSEEISNIGVRQAVDNLIKKNLQTELRTSDNDREEDMDVTLSIPYEIGGKRYAVRFSMSWE